MAKKFDLTKELNKAQKSQPSKKKKISYPVVSDFKEIADKIIKKKQETKSLNAELTIYKNQLLEAAYQYRVENGISGTIGFSTSENDQVIQAQEAERYTTNVEIDSEQEAELKKLSGNEFNNWFDVKRSIKLNDKALEDEEKLTKVIQVLQKEFGLDILDINQFIYPTTEFFNNRYKNTDMETQQKLDEILTPTRKIV